jgi:hypothetical protein
MLEIFACVRGLDAFYVSGTLSHVSSELLCICILGKIKLIMAIKLGAIKLYIEKICCKFLSLRSNTISNRVIRINASIYT